MQPEKLRAEPDPRGARVVLSWVNPAEPGFAGVRVLRREGRFPVVPGELGSIAEIHADSVTPAGAPARFVDAGVQGETVYYYAVVAFDAAAQPHPAFVSTTARSPFQTAAHLLRSLPEVYQLYDTVKPPDDPAVAAEDRGKGQLQRFVELLAQPFEVLRSAGAATRSFHDVGSVEGTLLPLLGQWIGQPTDTTLDLGRQRDELRFAPHYARTVGMAANLRAAINRLTNWDARLKEMVHSVLLSNHPEQLVLHEIRRRAGVWDAPRPLNVDVGHDGRAGILRTRDGRAWTLYHARSTPSRPRRSGVQRPSTDEWQLFYKIEDGGEALPARRLTHGPTLSKHPCAVERADGSVWVFGTERAATSTEPGGARVSLHVLSAGAAALPARIVGTTVEPFAIADGDTIRVTIGTGPGALVRTITARRERFVQIGAARAAEVARLLDSELPGVNAAVADDGRVELTSAATGAGAAISVAASALATALGLATVGAVTGRDGMVGRLLGTRAEPFALADGDALQVKVDGDVPRAVVFTSAAFADITQATAAEVVAAIEAELPGVAAASGGRVQLASPGVGEASLVAVGVDASPAAPKLGFGAPLPAPPVPADDEEPAALVDAADRVWLFWASRRNGAWNLWYDRFDGAAWAIPKPLTAGLESDREPFALFDPAGGGRLWVFWTRKKANGRANIFMRTTNQLDFAVITDADWQQAEMTPIPGAAEHDNREPAGIVSGAGAVELFFASNRTDGWNLWSKPITAGAPIVQGADVGVTDGQETARWPAPAAVGGGDVRLWYRSNRSRKLVSAVYPLTETIDARYSGSTTADTRNPARLSERRGIDDIQRYTYDTGKGDTNLYARDTVAVYLTPDIDDQALILRQRQLLASALRRVLPIQVRLVFLVERVDIDLVYTYDHPDAHPQRVIGEQVIETILPEVLRGLADEHQEVMNVHFLRTWLTGAPPAGLPDLGALPPDLSFRLFSRAFDEEA